MFNNLMFHNLIFHNLTFHNLIFQRFDLSPLNSIFCTNIYASTIFFSTYIWVLILAGITHHINQLKNRQSRNNFYFKLHGQKFKSCTLSMLRKWLTRWRKYYGQKQRKQRVKTLLRQTENSFCTCRVRMTRRQA